MKRHQGRLLHAVNVSHVLVVSIMTTLFCTGCGGNDWQAETYPAHGKITINEQPPVGAVVHLHAIGEAPDVRNSLPWAVVKEDGTYIFSTYEKEDGAPKGEYAVTIKWPPDVNTPSLADRLGGAFNKPDSSKWKVTITEGDNQLPPIDITGAKVVSKEQASAPRKAPPGPEMGK